MKETSTVDKQTNGFLKMTHEINAKLECKNESQMYTFSDRIHVIESLPNVWMLDGRIITGVTLLFVD